MIKIKTLFEFDNNNNPVYFHAIFYLHIFFPSFVCTTTVTLIGLLFSLFFFILFFEFIISTKELPFSRLALPATSHLAMLALELILFFRSESVLLTRCCLLLPALVYLSRPMPFKVVAAFLQRWLFLFFFYHQTLLYKRVTASENCTAPSILLLGRTMWSIERWWGGEGG